MNISLRHVKVKAASGDHAAEKIHEFCERLKRLYDINVSWANDGIGYIIALSPKSTNEEVEKKFFNEDMVLGL